MDTAVKKRPADILYKEVWELARNVAEARTQIGALRPSKLKTENVSAAFLEIDEIVKATEDASNAIMESAEQISDADPQSPDFADVVKQNCALIFEACAFQDLTGQRISKVLATLQLVDQHLEALQELLGPGFQEPEDETEDEEAEGSLLNGPAASGEGISQADIDALFD